MASASASPTVHTSRALRQQVQLHDRARDAASRAMDALDAGNDEAALQLFRVAAKEFSSALAVRRTFTPGEWDKGRGLHERMERTLATIQGSIAELEAKAQVARNVDAQLRARSAAPRAAAPAASSASRAASAPPAAAGKSATRPAALRNVDSKLADTILNEIVDKGPGVRWDDVIGLEGAKAALHEAVILPALRPDIFSGLREPARGVLLFGPPGTGKTLLAKAVATESKSTFFSITASSLTSKYMGESEKLVRALFAVAAELAPSVVFIDEIDSILSSRGGDNENEASRRLKTEFLVQWDGVTAQSNARVLILAATNFPASLDEAVRRRFARRIYIPLPDAPARAKTIQHLMRSTPHALGERDYAAIAAASDGYSGSDLRNVAKEAAMVPVRELGDRIRSVSASQMRPVNKDDFLKALRIVRPSVAPSSLAQYEQFERSFGA